MWNSTCDDFRQAMVIHPSYVVDSQPIAEIAEVPPFMLGTPLGRGTLSSRVNKVVGEVGAIIV
jgi:hypothetical protein